MRNNLVYLFCLGLLLGVCYLIADLTLKSFLSQDRLRVMLVEPLQDQLGRQVEIGSIKASVFSGIEIRNIVIKEKDPSKEFISIAAFRLNYEFLPLFEKRLVITDVLIDKPTVRIVKDTEGVYNLADLSLTHREVIKEVPPPELQEAKALPVTLVFDQIRVRNPNLIFTDQSNRLPAITSTDGDLSFNFTLGKTPAEARYKGNLDLIVNSEFQAHSLVLLVKSHFDQQLITFDGDLSAELDKLQFSGQLTNLLSTPDLTLNLQGAKFNLDNLLDGVAVDRQAGTKPLPAIVAPTGPTKPGPKIHAHGKIAVDEIQRDKVTMEKLALTYNFVDNILEVNDLSARIFGGTISGKTRLDLGPSSPTFRGQIKAEKLQLAAAMTALGKPQDYLTGDLNADFSGRGEGNNWSEIRNTLEGQGKFSISKGGMASSPLGQALATILGLTELNNLKFDKLTGTLKFAGGQSTLDAGLSARPLSLQAMGNIGMDGSLDLPLTVKLSPENSRRLQDRAAFARYLTDSSGRTTLYLKLKGTVDHPDLSLSSEGAGKQIGNVLGQKLGEEFGRRLSGQNSQNQTSAGESAGRLLNKLFGN